MNRAPLFSSADQTWNTPANVLRRVRLFDAIGLDPCSNAHSVVGARVEWRLERDGDSLPKDWRGHGLVYVNPPFSTHLLAWAKKCATSGAELLMLIPARTDAKWWQLYAGRADAICYWRGRLTFSTATATGANAPFPSALCYWGPRAARFAEVFGAAGLVALAPTASCSVCRGPLAPSARRHAQYHPRCRQAAYRARQRQLT